jgi:4-hydroxybenzoate polyprenyltransferase
MPSSDSPAGSSRLSAWGRLLRPPNLFTVPGDPLAGFVLTAGIWSTDLFWLCASSVFLYAAGLVFNDWFDHAEDLRDRPSRPLPSGRVARGEALIGAVLLSAAGVALAFGASWQAGFAALGVLTCILAYDAGGKKHPLAGPVLMGACRGASVLLGAIGAWALTGNPPWLALYAAGVVGGYVAAVTLLARNETQTRQLGSRRFAPAAVLGIWLALVVLGRLGELLFGSPGWMLLASLSLLAFAWAFQCGKRLSGTPAPSIVQQTIGFFLRGLLIVQAMFVSSMAIEPGGGFDPTGAGAAAGLLALWPVASIASRRFYAS